MAGWSKRYDLQRDQLELELSMGSALQTLYYRNYLVTSLQTAQSRGTQ